MPLPVIGSFVRRTGATLEEAADGQMIPGGCLECVGLVTGYGPTYDQTTIPNNVVWSTYNGELPTDFFVKFTSAYVLGPFGPVKNGVQVLVPMQDLEIISGAEYASGFMKEEQSEQVYEYMGKKFPITQYPPPGMVMTQVDEFVSDEE